MAVPHDSIFSIAGYEKHLKLRTYTRASSASWRPLMLFGRRMSVISKLWGIHLTGVEAVEAKLDRWKVFMPAPTTLSLLKHRAVFHDGEDV